MEVQLAPSAFKVGLGASFGHSPELSLQKLVTSFISSQIPSKVVKSLSYFSPLSQKVCVLGHQKSGKAALPGQTAPMRFPSYKVGFDALFMNIS